MFLNIILCFFVCFADIEDDRLRLAIVGFNDATSRNFLGNGGSQNMSYLKVISESLANVLQRDFNLVEREKVELIFKEQRLVEKNKLDPATAAQLGTMTGAEYLLTGTVTELNRDERVFKGYGIERKTIICRMAVSYRLLHTSTGEVFNVGESAVEKRYRHNPSPDTFIRDLAQQLSLEVSDQINKAFKDVRDR